MNIAQAIVAPDTMAVDPQWSRDESIRQNRAWLALLVARQRSGEGCLPLWLGLAPLEFLLLVRNYFPDRENWLNQQNLRAVPGADRGAVRQQLLELRRDEWLELRDLLLRSRSGDSELETFMANIVAAGCLGGDHLWRDMGLPDRAALRELLMLNFRPLASTNCADMKWKKFFYKQLCEQQGGYVCRAPSCQQCVAYEDCFGPEE